MWYCPRGVVFPARDPQVLKLCVVRGACLVRAAVSVARSFWFYKRFEAWVLSTVLKHPEPRPLSEHPSFSLIESTPHSLDT